MYYSKIKQLLYNIFIRHKGRKPQQIQAKRQTDTQLLPLITFFALFYSSRSHFKLENVQWISIPLQIGDPTRQVARLFPHPDIAIADQKLSFRTIAVISAYTISFVFSNSRQRSLLRRLPTITNN